MATVPWLPLNEIERRAQQLLNEHCGTEQPPIDPVGIARDIGIEVFAAEFSDTSISGALQYEGGKATIYFNASDARNRQRFTVAHELGHYVLHPDQGDFEDHENDLQIIYRWGGGIDSDSERERRRREFQANAFAAALLMPKDLVQSVLSDTEDLGDLAQVFGVSRSAIGYRITSLESLV